MSSRLTRELLILLALLLVVGLTALGAGRLLRAREERRIAAGEISIRSERTLSAAIVSHLERQYADQILTAPEHREAVDQILDRLLAALPAAFGNDLPYEVKLLIVDTAEENAYAFPGGIVVVNVGLIRVTENPEQLAAVIAHELGHVYHRDALSGMARSMGLGIILSSQMGAAAEIVEQVLRTVVESTFSRDQEARADRFAVELMAAAALPPDALADFFELIDTNERLERRLEYVSTHPVTEDRIVEVRSHAEQYPTAVVPLEIDWTPYKQSLPGIF